MVYIKTVARKWLTYRPYTIFSTVAIRHRLARP